MSSQKTTDLIYMKGHAGRGTRWFKITNSLY
jgi:hypothetical protein